MITIQLTDLFTAINTIILVGMCLFYFKKNYIIVEKETWDAAVEVCDAYNQEHQETQELAGGTGVAVGFGADYLEEPDEEEQEDE